MRKRILYYVEGWGSGGIESIVMDIIRSEAFKSNDFNFDIFCTCDWYSGFDQEIERCGGSRTVRFSGERPGLLKKAQGGIGGFENLLNANHYDVVHVNVTNGLGLIYSSLAKKYDVPTRIVHSHNSSFDNAGSKLAIKQVAHMLGKVMCSHAPTHKIACSQEAGEFVFDKGAFSVIPNGIDLARFSFDEQKRQNIRNQIDVRPDVSLIGSMGVLKPRKNPLFQLRVFSRYLEKDPEAVFIMVGSGEMDEEVLTLAKALGITDSLIRIPSVSNPEDYYSAMDALLMPSITEGFGLVAVEAQCSGLPVLMSDALPSATRATDWSSSLSLAESERVWAERLSTMLNAPIDRISAAKALRGTGLDKNVMAKRIVDLYLSN